MTNSAYQATTPARRAFFDTIFNIRYQVDHPPRPSEIMKARTGLTLAAMGIETGSFSKAVVTMPMPKRNDVGHKLKERGLEVLGLAGEIIFWQFDEDMVPDCPVLVGSFYAGDFSAQGRLEDVKKMREWVEANYVSTHHSITVAVDIDQRGSLETEYAYVSNRQMGRESFFPFLDKSIESYANEYMESMSQILLLIGPPGTGKTTFLRSLIMARKMKTMVAHRRKVIESTALYSRSRSGRYDALILEDADSFVGSREKGNELMTNLLQETQGIADASNQKIIISTNLETLNKVDAALYRPGRCFAILHFRPLKLDEVKKIWDDIGMQPHQLDDKKQAWTLSEILNPDLVVDKDHVTKPTKVGF